MQSRLLTQAPVNIRVSVLPSVCPEWMWFGRLNVFPCLMSFEERKEHRRALDAGANMVVTMHFDDVDRSYEPIQFFEPLIMDQWSNNHLHRTIALHWDPCLHNPIKIAKSLYRRRQLFSREIEWKWEDDDMIYRNYNTCCSYKQLVLHAIHVAWYYNVSISSWNTLAVIGYTSFAKEDGTDTPKKKRRKTIKAEKVRL